jgi:biofilm protein TabA
MIVDELVNWRRNYQSLKGLENVFKFLEEKANTKMPVGTKMPVVVGGQEIDDKEAFALSLRYTTVPPSESKFESHRRHVDTHFIISGEEIIGWSPVKALRPSTEYNAKEDYTLYEEVTPQAQVKVYPGCFIVFFPSDGHRPNNQLNGPCEVHKAYVKVSADRLHL